MPAPTVSRDQASAEGMRLRARSLGQLGAALSAVIIAIISSSSSDVAQAGTNRWTALTYGNWSHERCANPHWHHHLTGVHGTLAVDPFQPSFLLICGMGVSDRGGRGVQYVDDDYVSGFVFSKTTPSLVYGIGYHGLLRSVDGGKRWERLEDAPDEPQQIATTSSGEIYLIADSKLYRGHEESVTWERIGPTIEAFGDSYLPSVHRVEVAPSDPRALLVTADESRYVGLFRSRDAGGSWEQLTGYVEATGERLDGPRDVDDWAVNRRNPDVIHAIQGNRFYTSVDGGRTWTWRHNETRLLQLYLHPERDATLVATAEDGVYVTDDTGQHWQQATGIEGTVSTIAFDPVRPDTLYALTDDGPHQSLDAGLSWSPLHSAMPEHSVATSISRSASEPEVVYTVVDRPDAPTTVYRSDDGGWTWSDTAADLSWGRAGDSTFSRIVVSPMDPDVVAVIGYDIQWSFTWDGGKKWWLIAPQDCGSSIDELVYSPLTARTQYIVCDRQDRILRSDDGGLLWKAVDAQFEDQFFPSFASLAVAPTDADRLYVRSEQSGQIFRSMDGAETWEATGSAPAFSRYTTALAVSPEDADHLILANDEGIYESRSAGDSWEQISETPEHTDQAYYHGDYPRLLFDPDDPLSLLLAAEVVSVSNDGGRSWSPVRGRPVSEYEAAQSEPQYLNDLAWRPAAGTILGTDISTSWDGGLIVHLQRHADGAPLRTSLPAGGLLTTDSEVEPAPGATAEDPIELTLFSPVAGQVEIEAGHQAPPDAADDALPISARIQAPEASSDDPWVATIHIDSSVLPADAVASSLGILQGNRRIPDCLGGVRNAIPSSCVAFRRSAGDDHLIVLRGTESDQWGFDLGGAVSEAHWIYLPALGDLR